MNAIYLDQGLLRSLDWQPAGALSSAPSPFGLIVRNESGDYWIVRSGLLLELEFEPDAGQFLVRDPTDHSHIGLIPFEPSVVDRFILWLRFGNVIKGSSKTIQEKMAHIRAEKLRLLEQFHDGDLTAKEFLARLDDLIPKEIDAALRKELKLRSATDLPRQKWRVLGTIIFAFSTGLIASPVLYQKLFGYKTAEECVLDRGGIRGTVQACYELYPSASELRK